MGLLTLVYQLGMSFTNLVNHVHPVDSIFDRKLGK